MEQAGETWAGWLSTVMASPWYELLIDFQTAIIGIIGFWFVIRGSKYNARLIREQHELEREQNAEALKSSFLAELKMFQKAFKVQASGLPPQQGEVLLVPRIRRDVSVPLMKDIGLLTILGIDIDKILFALVSIDEFDRKVPIAFPNPNAEHFSVNLGKFGLLKGMAEGMDSALAPAIQELDSKQQIQLPHSANA
jgi:hypothetical protein